MTTQIIYQRFWCRRDTEANWAAANSTLAAGEIGVVLDGASGQPFAFKMGDGATAWLSLPYVGAAFWTTAGGTANALTATFDPSPVLYDGMIVGLRAANANTGQATLAVNGGAACAITKYAGHGLVAGDISASGHELLLRYRAATPAWELLNPAIPPVQVVNGRLTLESGVPVSITEQTAKTTVYFTPYKGNSITLWDGTTWATRTFTETSLALGTVTASLPYDVFGYLSSGVLALEKLAWTNATTRATAVTLQDGRYCKSGDKTRLYLGTFYTTSTTTTEDSGGGTSSNVGGKRFVWNYYNRARRNIAVIDTTDSWSYLTTTIRQARASTGNKVEMVIGIAEDAVFAQVGAAVLGGSNTAWISVGIGLDSTSAYHGSQRGAINQGVSGVGLSPSGIFSSILSAGYHYLSWNEKGGNAGTCVFLGDNAADGQQSALMADIFC